MPKNKHIIALAPIVRIYKEQIPLRISQKAAQATASHLEDYALAVAQNALTLSKHAARSTIMVQDIRE